MSARAPPFLTGDACSDAPVNVLQRLALLTIANLDGEMTLPFRTFCSDLSIPSLSLLLILPPSRPGSTLMVSLGLTVAHDRSKPGLVGSLLDNDTSLNLDMPDVILPSFLTVPLKHYLTVPELENRSNTSTISGPNPSHTGWSGTVRMLS